LKRLFCFVFISLLGTFNIVQATKTEAINGQIDLIHFNFKTSGIVKLNGQWQFFEGVLIKTYPAIGFGTPTKIKVPDSWNSYTTKNKIINGIGYGSYRIIINKRKEEPLTLLIKDIGSCYKVWVNNKLELTVGRIDTLESKCKPKYGKHSIELPNDTNRIEVVIEVANYAQSKGGITSYISLIRSNQTNLEHERESLRTYFCLGIIIIMGFYHLVLFFFYKKETASLNFGLFCFDIFIFLIFRSRLVYYFFDDFDWETGNRIEFIAQYLSLPLFYRFFSSSFPKQFKNLYKTASWILAFVLIGDVLLSDMRHFSITINYFHIILLLYIVFVVIGIIRALINKEDGMKIIFPGFLIFMLTLINDVLHVQNIINTGNFVIFGILGFIISQALFLAWKSVNNTKKIIKLSANLTELNHALECFVPSDFLKLLNKKNITEVELGNSVEKELTIMFSDIRAFTSISEKLSPTEAFDFINDFFRNMAPIISKHNGFIDKYIGDGIMALFPHTADDALLAGKAMMEELIRFNKKNEKAGKPLVAIGIGLHTGSCILGTVGEPRRMDTTVIADSVNLAARIEALTKFYKTPFIISEETHSRISSEQRPYMRFIGEARVKGKSIKTQLYKVFLDHKYDLNLLDKFDLGITHFYNKKFNEATKIFKELVNTDLNDGLLEFYINLSEKYSNQDLPEDWKTFQTFEY
jgi:class 3 adenylate cyclase